MIFVVSIDGNLSPLQVEKMKHEILNMRGVVSVEWQEAAEQSRALDAANRAAFKGSGSGEGSVPSPRQ